MISSTNLFYYSGFILSSITYDSSISLTTTFLQRYSLKFKNLESSRQKYVVTNINKSILLSFLAGIFIKSLYYKPQLLHLSNNDISESSKHLWRISTVLYASTDLVALFRDKTMSSTTKAHHCAVLLSLLIVLGSNFEKGSLSKAIVIYGGFSSLAFMVNLYLGSRFLFERNSLRLKYLKRLSLYTYVSACGLNWIWQGYYISGAYKNIFSNPNILIKLALNMTMLYSWIKDDTILIRHLSK